MTAYHLHIHETEILTQVTCVSREEQMFTLEALGPLQVGFVLQENGPHAEKQKRI